MSYLTSSNILFKHQYQFRSRHSTIHPIIHFLNYCAESSNKTDPEFTLAILCDLSKAFDFTLNSTVLIVTVVITGYVDNLCTLMIFNCLREFILGIICKIT